MFNLTFHYDCCYCCGTAGDGEVTFSDDVLADVDVIFASYHKLIIQNCSVGGRREEHIIAIEI